MWILGLRHYTRGHGLFSVLSLLYGVSHYRLLFPKVVILIVLCSDLIWVLFYFIYCCKWIFFTFFFKTHFRYTAQLPRASTLSGSTPSHQLRMDEGVAPMSQATPTRENYNRRSGSDERAYRYWELSLNQILKNKWFRRHNMKVMLNLPIIILEQFFCVGLGSICYLSCLDSCLQTYVLRKIKTARFMLCLS